MKSHLEKYNKCKWICNHYFSDGLLLLTLASQVITLLLLNIQNLKQKTLKDYLIYYVILLILFSILSLSKLFAGIFLMVNPYEAVSRVKAENMKRYIDIKHYKQNL